MSDCAFCAHCDCGSHRPPCIATAILALCLAGTSLRNIVERLLRGIQAGMVVRGGERKQQRVLQRTHINTASEQKDCCGAHPPLFQFHSLLRKFYCKIYIYRMWTLQGEGHQKLLLFSRGEAPLFACVHAQGRWGLYDYTRRETKWFDTQEDTIQHICARLMHRMLYPRP